MFTRTWKFYGAYPPEQPLSIEPESLGPEQRLLGAGPIEELLESGLGVASVDALQRCFPYTFDGFQRRLDVGCMWLQPAVPLILLRCIRSL